MIFMMGCNMDMETVYKDFQKWWNSQSRPMTSNEAAWGFLEDHANDYDFHIQPEDLIDFEEGN